MYVEERTGAPVRRNELKQINQCMQECKMIDVKATGNFYTWNKKQEGNSRVYSKIDRVMANQAWLNAYDSAKAGFSNEGTFDHAPAVSTVFPRDHSGS